MRKLLLVPFVGLLTSLSFAGIAGATTPVVDPETEVTSLFNTHAPTVVAVVLAIAGFSITMSVLAAGIRKIRGALGKAG